MHVSTSLWTPARGWVPAHPAGFLADLVLYFISPGLAANTDPWPLLSRRYAGAHVVGCTTGGEILGEDVQDDTLVAAAIRFDHATVRVAAGRVTPAESRASGQALAANLPAEDLRLVYVLADGMLTNGSALIAGLRETLSEDVLLTGGLAGDGAAFCRTLVGCDGPPVQGQVAAVGLYGKRLRLGWGSVGGWERFGPERTVTCAQANVLYELDGEPALDLYKRYLGDEAANLPGSALLFPLTVRPHDAPSSAVVRTVVGVDEAARSMTFAGDIPPGSIVQLMRGNFDGLVEGAAQAGERAAQGPCLALLVRCIGSKLLMGQRIAEEVEAVAEALGPAALMLGFYSYGEIAPHGFTGRCELHNQTMTVTTIGEA